MPPGASQGLRGPFPIPQRLRQVSPTKACNFKSEMMEEGDLTIRDIQYRRMQLPTVREILAAAQFETPMPVGLGSPHEPISTNYEGGSP